jgi:hypothetical protein
MPGVLKVYFNSKYVPESEARVLLWSIQAAMQRAGQ